MLCFLVVLAFLFFSAFPDNEQNRGKKCPKDCGDYREKTEYRHRSIIYGEKGFT